MTTSHPSPHTRASAVLPEPWGSLLQRANQIARTSDMKELYRATLALLMDVAQAEAGAMYQYQSDVHEVLCHVAIHPQARGVGECYPLEFGLLALQPENPEIAWYPQVQEEEDWPRTPGARLYPNAQSLLVVPFASQGRLIALAELYNPQKTPYPELSFLAERLVSELDKAAGIFARWRDNARLQALIAVIGELSSTLDKDRLLRLLITYAAELLNAEASSLFLLEDESRELVLHLASNWKEVPVEKVRIPADKGIIGHVVSTGETIITHDTQQDTRHYQQVDRSSGFLTHSILAVPLRVQSITLGEDLGQRAEHIIGGLEAINKRIGRFTQQDANLLTLLANQAATILEVADLYTDANDLFLGVIQAMVAAIDAKDPYTEGHSRRVSEFSIAIAQEMNLPPDFVHKVRIGSLLHDIGKIGIPDEILRKPGRLTDAEFARMKEHPTIGARIMAQVHTLQEELPAIAEHHERLDGTGYPRGLRGEEISLLGRIVAAADVFDALTSDRPYRKALSAEDALAYLHQNIGSHFDPECVEALTRAYLKEKVRTQKERIALQRALDEL
ncbi:MAG: HD domain-containing protein [Anaerolineae bacterium]|nr:MAG: HD domain-containing protein [Anaerolineae bacterium]